MFDQYIVSVSLEKDEKFKGDKIIYSMCQVEARSYEIAKEKAFFYYSNMGKYDYIKILSCKELENINKVA